MTDADITTMSDAERASYYHRLDRERREAALDKALADRDRFQAEHPDEDCDVVVEIVDAVEEAIIRSRIETLGDIRLFAKALLDCYEGCVYDNEDVDRLLNVLKALPERLWDEPIGQVEEARP